MHLSDWAFRFARNHPKLTRPALWLWSRIYVWGPRDAAVPCHWAFHELADLVYYRVPARARLGNGMAVTVPWNCDIGRAIFESGYYESETVHLLEKILSEGMVFFDIGANIGQYSLVASRLVGSTGQVHSFEPDPITFRWFARNVRKNRLQNVQLNAVALFDEAGKKQLYLANSRDTGSNSFAVPWTFSGQTFEVSCTTLDDYLKSKQISHVDVMKLDIEGSEQAALSGGSTLFTGRHKPLIIVEFEEERQHAFGTSCAAMAQLLKTKGYELFASNAGNIEPFMPGPDSPRSLNVLAIPHEKIDSVLRRVELSH